MEELRVLIVDDDPDVSNFIRLRLSREAPHFSLAVVGSGLECIEHLMENEVDCILSDYQMPGMDGMELLGRLRMSGRKTPFIFITGQGSEEVAREAFVNGACDYFTKDVGFAHFARIVNSVEQAVRVSRSEEMKLRAERSLVEEQIKLEAILASIGDGISIQDTDLKILYQNQAHVKMTGEHVGEFCYKAYEGSGSPCEGCPVKKSFESGETSKTERSILRDGRELWFQITASPVRDNSGRIAAGIEVVRDVTERVAGDRERELYRSELELRERKYGRLIKSIEKNHFIYSHGTDGVFTYLSGTIRDMLGYSPEEFQTHYSTYLTDNPVNEEVRRHTDLSLEGVQQPPYEVEIYHKDGGVRWLLVSEVPVFDDKGAVIAVEGIACDVTESKRAQEDLTKFKFMVDGAGEEVYLLDPSGRFVYVNEAAARNFGYAKEDILEMSVFDLDPISGRKAWREGFGALKRGDVPPFEVTHVTRDGRLVPKEVKAVYLRIQGDEYICAFAREITERKDLERQRDDFYAMVTHDLKSPLMVVLGYSNLLLSAKGSCLGAEEREMLSAIHSGGKKLLGMVEGSLERSGLESGRFSASLSLEDIGGLLLEVRDDFSEAMKKKDIVFLTEIAGGIPVTLADRRLLQRAVSNLLENAANYTPEGGSVTLAAGYRREGDEECIVITVSDTGPGIPEAERDRVFEKYYRSPRAAKGKGTGLGLAIVKAVAEAHGGTAGLSSKAGGGSVFSITLPVRAA